MSVMPAFIFTDPRAVHVAYRPDGTAVAYYHDREVGGYYVITYELDRRSWKWWAIDHGGEVSLASLTGDARTALIAHAIDWLHRQLDDPDLIADLDVYGAANRLRLAQHVADLAAAGEHIPAALAADGLRLDGHVRQVLAQLAQSPEADEIELYEDNAGGLYLRHGPTVWAEVEHTGSTFTADAEAIAAGDVVDFTLPTLPTSAVDGCALIATWHAGAVTVHGATLVGSQAPPRAAREYLARSPGTPDRGRPTSGS